MVAFSLFHIEKSEMQEQKQGITQSSEPTQPFCSLSFDFGIALGLGSDWNLEIVNPYALNKLHFFGPVTFVCGRGCSIQTTIAKKAQLEKRAQRVKKPQQVGQKHVGPNMFDWLKHYKCFLRTQKKYVFFHDRKKKEE